MPSRHSQGFATAVTAVLLVFALVPESECAGQPAIPGTPVAMSSEMRPAFREMLKPADYREQSGKVLSGIGNIKLLENSERPVVGSRITRLVRGGQAEDLGLQVGDIIEQIDGQRIWSDSFPDADSTRRLRYFDVSVGSVQTARFEPGKIGIWSVPHWHPELLYVHQRARRGAWDKDVLVGIAARDSHPDLAETAWHHAVSKGYRRDRFSAQFGAAIALAQGRAEVAAEFADLVRQDDVDQTPEVHPLIMYRVAMANYQLKDAYNLVRSYPLTFEIEPEVLLYEIDRQHNLSPAERNILPPHKLAQTMYRDDLLPGLRGRDFYSIKQMLPAVRRGETLKMEASAGTYKFFRFGPADPVPNIDLTVRVKAKPSSNTSTEFTKLVSVGLQYNVVSDQNEILMLRLEEQVANDEPGCIVRPSHSAGFVRLEYQDPRVLLDGTHEHEIRLIRVGGQGEIYLNGTRILYGPVTDQVAPVNAFIRTIGMSIEVTSLKVHELIETP